MTRALRRVMLAQEVVLEFPALCKAGFVLMVTMAVLVISVRPDGFKREFVHASVVMWHVVLATVLMVLALSTRSAHILTNRSVSVALLLVMFVAVARMLRPIAPILTMYAGVVSNSAVMLANGGRMPVMVEGFDGLNHVSIHPATRLWFLGDVFPIMSGEFVDGAFSIGDILICVGFWWISARMLSLLQKP